MLFNKTVTLVIPCRNEEVALAKMLKQVPSYVDEVIVVDNRSTDNTPKVAKKLGATVIKEKRHINGIGYGFAHQTGLKNASGDFIVTLDGDNTYPLNKIKSIISEMERKQLDMAACSRFPLQNPAAISKVRQLGVFILNLEASLLYGFPFRDILTGMWVVRKTAVSQLELKSGDWNFSPEIKLAALNSKQLKFDEVHIPHFYRENGVSKQAIWKTGFEHLWYIAKRRFTTDNSFYQFMTKLNFSKMNYASLFN
jgi:glycosyltransferase involved in cell wall biosynthesis